MPITPFPTHSNGNTRSRRVRPEHVALTIERVEHLIIEIRPPKVTVARRLKDLEAAAERQHRQAIADRIAAATTEPRRQANGEGRDG
jgi:hypothetical protein